MKICPKCNYGLNPEAVRWCGNCGFKFDPEAVPPGLEEGGRLSLGGYAPARVPEAEPAAPAADDLTAELETGPGDEVGLGEWETGGADEDLSTAEPPGGEPEGEEALPAEGGYDESAPDVAWGEENDPELEAYEGRQVPEGTPPDAPLPSSGAEGAEQGGGGEEPILPGMGDFDENAPDVAWGSDDAPAEESAEEEPPWGAGAAEPPAGEQPPWGAGGEAGAEPAEEAPPWAQPAGEEHLQEQPPEKAEEGETAGQEEIGGADAGGESADAGWMPDPELPPELRDDEVRPWSPEPGPEPGGAPEGGEPESLAPEGGAPPQPGWNPDPDLPPELLGEDPGGGGEDDAPPDEEEEDDEDEQQGGGGVTGRPTTPPTTPSGPDQGEAAPHPHGRPSRPAGSPPPPTPGSPEAGPSPAAAATSPSGRAVAFAGAAPAGEEVPRLKPGALQRRDWAAEIAAAKRSTWGMMLLFALLIAAVGWAVGYWMMGSGELGAAAAAAVAAVALAGAWFGGPSAILATAGARPADREKDRVFVNVVEEISLAAGVPVPRAFVIETGEANAFATGRDPGRASVAVTRGLLESLNRDQLQAVVAHELGHVRNYDIRYMMIIAALVGVVVLLADVVRRYWWLGGRGRSRSSGGRGGGQAQLVLMVVSLLLILLAPLFARMLQMAVSRRREYLADASAVEFTRNPLALAEALEKIKYHDVMDPETPVDPESDERRTRNRALQHLYIVNPVKEILETTPSLFATHPPINHRIRRLREMVL